jgi:hypothetical protein
LHNHEAKLRPLLAKLKAHGPVLLVVDQPATVGALPVAVARAEGVLVAYMPGLALRRIADLHAGESKTDARDAYIIAEAARSLPHILRSLKLADSQVAESSPCCVALMRIWQAKLRRSAIAFADHPAILDLLERHPSPAQLAALSQKQLANRLVKLAPRIGKAWAA